MGISARAFYLRITIGSGQGCLQGEWYLASNLLISAAIFSKFPSVLPVDANLTIPSWSIGKRFVIEFLPYHDSGFAIRSITFVYTECNSAPTVLIFKRSGGYCICCRRGHLARVHKVAIVSFSRAGRSRQRGKTW